MSALNIEHGSQVNTAIGQASSTSSICQSCGGAHPSDGLIKACCGHARVTTELNKESNTGAIEFNKQSSAQVPALQLPQH